MTKDLVTNVSFCVGLGPGQAVEFRSGEIQPFDDEIADKLLQKPFVSIAAAGADMRRVSRKDRLLKDEIAARVSPPHDQRRLDEEVERKANKQRLENVELENRLLREQIAKLTGK